jgi:L-seryl-tRNA(Ser) seleniumtransferase
MMTLAGAEVMERAERMMNALMPAGMLKITISPAESIIGGGTAPTATLPSYVLGITCEGKSADGLQSALRRNDPPIVARVEEGAVLLDLRTVFPEQDPQIVEALLRIAES